MDGHLPSLGWSPTNPWMVNYQKEVYYRHGIWHLTHTKLTPGDKCHGCSPTISKIVTHHSMDGQPPEKNVYYRHGI